MVGVDVSEHRARLGVATREEDLPPLHGVVPIMVTPFDRQDRVDEESLRRLVDFTIGGGVHGLGIALGSEISKLTDDERALVLATIVDQARGRVPVMMNTGTVATRTAVRFSRLAEEGGAAAVICTAPGSGVPQEEVRDYFASISRAVHIPVIIQDTSDNHVPPALLHQLGETCEHVLYAKVESAPPAQRVGEAVAACGAGVGIFGGAGGGALLQELRRGSIGTMPWPSTPRPFVDVWTAWWAGDWDRAQQLFDSRIAPVLRLAAGGLGVGHRVHKELLRRQGIIADAQVRRPAAAPDPITWDELAQTCELLGLGRDQEG